MNYEQLLPIGSVVLLHDAEKKLMVFGIGPHDNATEKDFDYVGVVYPEGMLGEESMFLFNHSDIQEVCFRGFENEEREDFIAFLQANSEKAE